MWRSVEVYPLLYDNILILHQVESSLTSAFIELIVKLNETAFRPIFRKMFDWAFGNGLCFLRSVDENIST